jgi:hypothetical protein
MNKTSLFSLNILPLEELVPLEKPLHSRIEAVKKELERTNHLTNPLLVAQEGAGELLLLGGSDQFEALKALNVRDVVAQIIYPHSENTEVLTWYHLVRRCRREYLLQVAKELQLRVEMHENEIDYNNHRKYKQLLCVFLNGESFRIIAESDDLARQAEMINAFVESYQACSSCVKLYPDNRFLDSAQMFDLGELLIIPPRYTRQELLYLAREKILFPAGYLNVILDNRVIGLDFPLDVLRSATGIEEKQGFLKDLIRLRLQSENSTVFGGRVFYMGRSMRESHDARTALINAKLKFNPNVE